MSLPEQIQVVIFFWVSPIYNAELFSEYIDKTPFWKSSLKRHLAALKAWTRPSS